MNSQALNRPDPAVRDLVDAATSAYDALEHHFASKPKAGDPDLHRVEGVRLLTRLIAHTVGDTLRAAPNLPSGSHGRRQPPGQPAACPACGSVAEAGSLATA